MAKGYGQSPSAMLTRWARFPGAGLSLRRESAPGYQVDRIPGACPETRTRGTQVITPWSADNTCRPTSASIRYLETCTQSRTGRSSAPPSPTPRIGTGPSGWSRPHSVTRSLRVIHVQSTFSHFQSTFSHMWIHIQSTWGSTYVDPHARGHRGIYGVQRRMVETM